MLPAVLSRYYNGNVSNYTEDHLMFLRDFFLAQLDSYESGDGWMFWTMKTEGDVGAEWDFFYLRKNGIIPQDLCSREHYCY